jgi:osmoprotectant transport system ATP-binding protein
MNPACVAFEDVYKAFGTTEALAGVTLNFPDKAITAIVGKSGSGKSTLLQHINGMLRPDRGVVRVFGQPVDYADLSRFRRGIGYAVQGIGLFPHLTVQQNIALLARLEGWSPERREQRVYRLMATMALDNALANRYPHQLSGGQQQRVGLCRAMMLAPRLLLLDEAFSGVDPITRAALHERILALHAEDAVSIVLVTHDMREAERLASHIVVLLAGRVVQAGDLNSLRADPAHPYVRELLEARE